MTSGVVVGGGGVGGTRRVIRGGTSTTMTSTTSSSERDLFSHWKRYTKESKDGSSSLEDDDDDEREWSEEQYKDSLDLYDRLMACDDDYLAPFIKEALQTLDGAYRLYGPRCVVGSYNGGKDAVVIMHLLRAAHAKYHHNQQQQQQQSSQAVDDNESPRPKRPRVIYFENKHEFPEVLSFLHETTHAFDLSMTAFDPTFSFVTGLSQLVRDVTPIPLAFVLGTRRGDPNAGTQGTFAPSSDWMPPFMRVNPVIRWTYGHVWHFLRLFHLPYCSLYDEGYTSLGTVKDTLPCPALKRIQGGYLPAYMLRDWEMERAGRISKEERLKREQQRQRDDDEEDEDGGIPKVVSSLSIRDASATTSYATSNDDSRPQTVGLVIIGDEILKGITQDINTQAAAVALRSNGVPLARVVVVSDDQDEIVSEIQSMMREVDIIITSGGVGPTHDDVTLKSIGVALSSPLAINREMLSFLQTKLGSDLSDSQMKMALMPKNSKLRRFGDSEWPVLQCRNIFVLPGVPQFFEQKVALIAPHLAREESVSSQQRVTQKVVLSVDETTIADGLTRVVERHPHVSFGSYPFVSHPDYKTVVTLEGKETRSQRSSFVGLSVRRKSGSALDGSDDHSHFTRDQIDLNVKVALEDLLLELPDKSVLRVEHDDNMI
eukprot:CAMPEP_0172503736 /NCGR_PEP_ID=MMETSP1066-20121228/171777_1 /TAXON_ID=671091 /ORGANISM="Coscinodiscus wailesii, Strain CCMP2513" /LENGTH=656 /DNA_ID=CAMNT_0013279585 /DNA_START=430 /DNA_END=2400 /DNA_ORIENTATION=+